MKAFLAVCSALLLGGCASSAAAPQAASDAAPLAGTSWIGVVDASMDRNSLPRIEFVDGRLSGFTGCNMMSGAWTAEGGAARLSGVAITKRMCLGPAGEVEKRVLAAVTGESRARREGDKLVFTAPSGARFEFVPAR